MASSPSPSDQSLMTNHHQFYDSSNSFNNFEDVIIKNSLSLVAHIALLKNSIKEDEIFKQEYKNTGFRFEKLCILNTLCCDLVFKYSTIIEMFIKLLYAHETECITKNKTYKGDIETITDVKKMIDELDKYNYEVNFPDYEINRKNHKNLYTHKIYEICKKFKSPKIKKLFEDEYNFCYNEIKKRYFNTNIKIATFEESLYINENYMLNLKYKYRLNDKIIPCGVIWTNDKDEKYLFIDHEYNFVLRLLERFLEPNFYAKILL